MFQRSPNYHLDGHLMVTSPSPQPSPHLRWVTATKGHLWRVVFVLIGAVTVWVQVSYVWASLPTTSDLALRVAPILFTVSLAVSLCVVEYHWHRGERGKAVAWFIAFLILLIGNGMTTLTRVAEIRAAKAAAGEHVGDVLANVKKAQARAEAAEDAAHANMDTYCAEVTTNTNVETTQAGKKKSSTTKSTTTTADPRCSAWTDQYTRASSRSEAARAAVANATITSSADGISPAAKSVSQITGWNEVTVDHGMDFVQPCALDALALVCFLTAFSVRTSPAPRSVRVRPNLSVVAREPPPGAYSGNATLAKGLSQSEVNEVVGRWIAAGQLPVGERMREAQLQLLEWARLDTDAISEVTFGRALTAWGVGRRVLNGRKVICAPKA